MVCYTDTVGRVWTLAVTVFEVKRVRTRIGVDLVGLVGDGFRPLAELMADPVRVVDVLWALCDRQAAALGVDEEAFAAALAGDVYERAAEALTEALFDFFPGRTREKLARVRRLAAREVDAMARQADLALTEAESTPPLSGRSAGGSPGVRDRPRPLHPDGADRDG